MTVAALALLDLARSGLTAAHASAAGIGAIANAAQLCAEYANAPALVIPYYDVNGDQLTPPFARIRYLVEVSRNGKSPWKQPKPQRYAQPSKSGVHAYFPHCASVNWQAVAANTTHPLVVVEGEKKALAACVQGFATIGLGGVYNFLSQGDLLPELAALDWRNRSVYICFDSDAAHNPQIQAAEARLATELSLKRGATLHLVRLVDLPDGGKQGVDDYLVRAGPEQLEQLLTAAPRMRKIDAEVISLNEHIAWIEKEGCVYDLRSKEFISKANLVNGSTYSTLQTTTPKLRGSGVKIISVAESWLKHEHAQRYDYVEFRPDTASAVLKTGAEGLALNMWTGWKPEAGDVSPFLELTAHLFSELREHQHLPIHLMAYKAQNPGIKVPLALVLLSSQGSGKSLWAECVCAAFYPYIAEIPASAINSQFNGWTERTLLAVINDAGEVLQKNAPQLRTLISDKRVMLNDKFRLARQIDSYTMYIITANERGAGAFSADDRRMIVVGCPPKREEAFYTRVVNWRNAGGGRHLLDYLLHFDLQGWTPPQSAPMTAEKYMAYMESLTPIQRLAEEMQTATNHVIVLWIQSALSWPAQRRPQPTR